MNELIIFFILSTYIMVCFGLLAFVLWLIYRFRGGKMGFFRFASKRL